LTARAQQPGKLPTIGFLNPRSMFKGEAVAAAFRPGLRDAGFEEGRNVAVEYRWAEDQYDRFPALALDLVTRGVTAMGCGQKSNDFNHRVDKAKHTVVALPDRPSMR
jgi:putative tryptophan/tyrosine transport system substrate-binding protein